MHAEKHVQLNVTHHAVCNSGLPLNTYFDC